MEIRFYFWKISIGVIFEIEVLPIGKIRIAKNCNFIKELFNVVDLPGRSFVGIRGERIVFSEPNTNTNIIRVHKFDRIRIRILFVIFIMTEYEYEYYSGSEI